MPWSDRILYTSKLFFTLKKKALRESVFKEHPLIFLIINVKDLS